MAYISGAEPGGGICDPSNSYYHVIDVYWNVPANRKNRPGFLQETPFSAFRETWILPS